MSRNGGPTGGQALGAAVAVVAVGLLAKFWSSVAPAVEKVRAQLPSLPDVGPAAPSGGLSPRRMAAIAATALVVPATYPSERFSTMAPGYDPADPKLPKGFTTCGYLPGFVGGAIGINTKYGLASIRDEAKKYGAWVEAGGDKRPKPGDFFLLGTVSGGIAHTGEIVDASGPIWKTADAGQGARDKQETRFVDRPYDAAAVTLGGPAGPRPLLGWMDIDKMPDNRKPAPAPAPPAAVAVAPRAGNVGEAAEHERAELVQSAGGTVRTRRGGWVVADNLGNGAEAPQLLVDGGEEGGETTAPLEGPAAPAAAKKPHKKPHGKKGRA